LEANQENWRDFWKMLRSTTALVLVGLHLLGCTNPADPSQGGPAADYVERALPTKTDWLKRVLASPDDPIDLVEAATVIASSESGINQRYSTIYKDLEPYLRRIRERIRPETTDGEKIDLLNEILLPSIVDPKTKTFQWIREAFGSPQGSCLPNTLLYLIAAEAIHVPLELIAPPWHVYLRYTGRGGTRNIEATSRGEHLSEAQYRDIISKTQGVNEPFPEDPELWKQLFTPISKRQFVADLMLARTYTTSDPKNQYEGSLAAWQLVPYWVDTLRELARHHAIRLEYDRAIELLSKAIERAPYWPMLYQERSFDWFERGKPEEALVDIDTALKLAPHYARFHHERADILWKLGKAHEAALEEGAPDATSVLTVPTPGWEEVQMEKFHFRIFFPGAPMEQKQVLKTEQGTRIAHLTLDMVNYSLLVSVLDRSTGVLKEKRFRTILDYSRDGAVENSKARILSETLITVSDYPGRRLLLDAPGGIVSEMVLIQVNNYTYAIAVAQSKERKYERECREFLDSFKLLGMPLGDGAKH